MSAGIMRKVGLTRRYFGWLCAGCFTTCFMTVVFLQTTCRADGAMHQCRVLEDYLKHNPAHLFEFKCKHRGQQTINQEGVLNQFIASNEKIGWTSPNEEIMIDDFEVSPKERKEFLNQFMQLHRTQPKEQEFKSRLWVLVKKKLSDCIHKASDDPRGCNVLQLKFTKSDPKPGELHVHILSGERTSPIHRQDNDASPASYASFQRIRNSAITEDVTNRCLYTNMGLGTANLVLFLGTGIMMWVTRSWLEIRCGKLDAKRTQWVVRDSIESQDDFISRVDLPLEGKQEQDMFQPGHWGAVYDPFEDAQRASCGRPVQLAKEQLRHQSAGYSTSVSARSWMSVMFGGSSSN